LPFLKKPIFYGPFDSFWLLEYSILNLKFYLLKPLGFIEKPRSLTMRIDGFQNIPAVLQSLQTDKQSKANPESESSPSSSVSLSSFAEVLQSLQRDSAQAAKTRSARVDQLAQQAQNGKLSVDLEKLATNLVSSQVIDTKG
jgi:flagellar biosynthesis anti-sigma factor FlgM